MEPFKKQIGMQLGIGFGLVILAATVVQLLSWHAGQNAGEITRLRNELDLRTRATESLATLKSDAEKAKPFQQKLDGILPTKDRLINFGKEMTDLAKADGAEMNFDFGAETAAKAGVPGFIKFSLTGKSSYTNWYKFLKDLEKSPLYIKINSTDLTRQPGADTFNVVAEGQVFFQ
ncbi:MAG: hypothetical protein Q8L24_02645 [bacterium]|nr:hypothetical protein [bacterium]